MITDLAIAAALDFRAWAYRRLGRSEPPPSAWVHRDELPSSEDHPGATETAVAEAYARPGKVPKPGPTDRSAVAEYFARPNALPVTRFEADGAPADEHVSWGHAAPMMAGEAMVVVGALMGLRLNVELATEVAIETVAILHGLDPADDVVAGEVRDALVRLERSRGFHR